MRLVGRASAGYEHVCHQCQGKAAKRLWRQITKRQKAKEKREWKREANGG